MKIYRLLLLMLLCVLSEHGFAQTHVFPATDTNNNFTGQDTFTQLQGCQYVNALQSFAAALSAAGTSGCIGIPPGSWPVSVNTSVPAGVTLDFVGGLLAIANGVTLTVNGPIFAPQAQIFSYTGTGTASLAGASVPVISAVWFPGTDICGRINAALLSLPASGDDVDASSFGGTQPCASNPWANVTAKFNLSLGAVLVQSSALWTWTDAQSGSSVVGTSGFSKTVIQYTGSTVSPFFWQIASATPSTVFVQDIVLRNMTIRGNANTTDVLLLKGTHRSFLDNISFKDATGCGLHTQFAVADSYFRLRTTAQDGVAFIVTPTCGFNFGQIDSSHQTTAGTILDLAAENINGIGVELSGAASLVFTAGTSEGNTGANGRGVQIDAASNGNRIMQMDMEANAVEDVLINGSNNKIEPAPATKLVHVGATGNYNRLTGEENSIQIDASATGNVVDAMMNCQGSGTFTNNGTGTIVKGLGDCSNGGKPQAIPWTFRETTAGGVNVGTHVANPVERLFSWWKFTTTPSILSDTAVNSSSWRLLFNGYWTDSTDGAGLAQPAYLMEATAASPTITVGTVTVTFAFVAGGLQATASAGTISFLGQIISANNNFSAAGVDSANFKGRVLASLHLSNGVACTNGELALSAGWQSTGSATATAVQGTGQTCSWTITTGTTTAANPTITDTLTNVLPTATTVCWMNIYGGTHTAVAGESLRQTTLSATAPIFTANFTPTAAGTTYFVTRGCGP